MTRIRQQPRDDTDAAIRAEYLSRAIGRALDLGALPVWDVEAQMDAEGVCETLEAHGIRWDVNAE